MLHRLFNLATILSLALLASTVALLVRSYNTGDRVSRTRSAIVNDSRLETREIHLMSGHGDILLFYRLMVFTDKESVAEVSPHLGPDRAATSYDHYYIAPVRPEATSHSMLDEWGFYTYSEHTSWSASANGIIREIGCPLWFIAGMAAILPAAWIMKRRRRLSQKGHCHSCGYNLTANISGVCPECGSKVAA